MAHESQTDAKKGFGGKFGVQSDRVDKSAVGFEYHEKLSSHASQKGLVSSEMGITRDLISTISISTSFQSNDN